MWSPICELCSSNSKTVETVPPKEESNLCFSAADALAATQETIASVEYQMQPVYVKIKEAIKKGKTDCIIFGEHKEWLNLSLPYKYEIDYEQEIIDRLKELGYKVQRANGSNYCALEVSWKTGGK